jgi:acyl carrier protein
MRKIMNLNREKIRDGIIQALHESLGADDTPDIDEQTDPFRDLGQDSEDGVDFACFLSEKFGFEIPPEVNPFVDDARQRSRSVGEMTDLMCHLMEQETTHARE